VTFKPLLVAVELTGEYVEADVSDKASRHDGNNVLTRTAVELCATFMLMIVCP
jgi:hypothetical protein